MLNPTYLIKSRHDIYYFRYPVHPSARGADKRVSVSLRTRCPKEALRLAKVLEYHGAVLMDRLDLQRMKHSEIVNILKRYFSESLAKFKERVDDSGPLAKDRVKVITEEMKQIGDMIAADCDDVLELYGCPDEHGQSFTDRQVLKVMQSFDLDFDVESKEFSAMKRAYKHVRLEHFKNMLAYNSQVYSVPEVPVTASSVPVTEFCKLGPLIEDYLQELEPSLSARAYKDQADCLDYLVDALGVDFLLSHLAASDVQSVKRMLQDTPTGRNKGRRTKDKALREQIEVAKRDDLQRLSVTSVNKYLGYFSSLMEWAKCNSFIEKNLFSGVRVKGAKKKIRRDLFSKAEVSKILLELEGNASGLVKNKSQYWGALLAVYTGARRNEIAALTVDDVKVDDETGVLYFDISDESEEGKEIKTEAARRLVPVHSRLIELGFMEFLKKSKELSWRLNKQGMKTRLLFDMTYTDHDKWGRKLGRFMNESLLPHLGLHVKNKKTLHSLRHSFITYLSAEGVEAATIKSIVGHEQDTVTFNVYTHYGVEHLPQFKAAIERLVY